MRDWLGHLPHSVLIAIAVLLLAVIACASYWISADLPFSFFYLVPIALTAWFLGRRAGILFSFLGAGVWLAEALVEHRPAETGVVLVCISAVLLLGFYLVSATLLADLRDALQRETAVARVDPLTQISNRRAFFELAETEIQRVARYGGRLTVAYMDLDNLKQVNDREGHEMGDRVLVLAAEVLRGSLRVSDIVARLGGDEFIVLLPETGTAQADVVLQKLQNQIADVMAQGRLPVTVSIGAATFERAPESVEQMVRLVDELMYSAKTGGKNRIEKRVIGR